MTARVKNLTGDDLGWGGITVPAGEVVEVPEEAARRMVTGNPQKFRYWQEEDGAPESEPRSGAEEEGEAAPRHRHYFRKSDGNRCRCGLVRQEDA